MAEPLEFIDCTSLSITFDIMGIATINFTIIANTPGLKVRTTISAGGRTFVGYVTNASCTPLINAPKWYANNITLITTTA